jgi:hypothetical protein
VLSLEGRERDGGTPRGGGLRRENVRTLRHRRKPLRRVPIAAIARSDYLRSQDLNIPIMKVPDQSGLLRRSGAP